MKRILALALAGMTALTAGCVLDDNSSDKKDTVEATSIKDLSIGGGVFYFKNEGYALAQFGTFYGSTPFENARVFVNGMEMQNKMGLFSNAQPLTAAFIDNGKPVRITVYALGDSAVYTLALPEAPVIVKPVENAQLTLGDSLTVEISYPGDHQFISMAFDNQDKIAVGVETNEKYLRLPIPGSRFITEGKSLLTAMSTNASGPIPKDFDINNQYKLFIANTMVIRQVNFVKK